MKSGVRCLTALNLLFSSTNPCNTSYGTQLSLDQHRRSRLFRRSRPGPARQVRRPGLDPAHWLPSRTSREDAPRCQPPNGLWRLCGVSPPRSRRRGRRSPRSIAASGCRRLRQRAFPTSLRRFAALRAGRGRAFQRLGL